MDSCVRVYYHDDANDYFAVAIMSYGYPGSMAQSMKIHQWTAEGMQRTTACSPLTVENQKMMTLGPLPYEIC